MFSLSIVCVRELNMEGTNMTYQKVAVNFFADEVKVLEAKIKSIARNLANLIAESDLPEIKVYYQTIKSGRYSGQAYLQETDVKESTRKTIYDIGYMDALLDLAQLYLEKLSEIKEIDGIKTKYKDEILLILMDKRIMFHKDLAGAIGVSPSGLNAVIKQMNASSVRLINVESVSKFKLYSLTPAGYRYCLKLEKEKREEKEKDQFRFQEKCLEHKDYFIDECLSVQWNTQRKSTYEYRIPYSAAAVRTSDKYINKDMEAGISNWCPLLPIKASY